MEHNIEYPDGEVMISSLLRQLTQWEGDILKIRRLADATQKKCDETFIGIERAKRQLKNKLH